MASSMETSNEMSSRMLENVRCRRLYRDETGRWPISALERLEVKGGC